MTATGRLEVTREGRVATIRLDNPPHNFVTATVVHELADLVERLERDRSVRAVVFAGDGKRWFTHYDPPEILAGIRLAGGALTYRQGRVAYAAARAIERVPPLAAALRRSRFGTLLTFLRLEHTLGAIAGSGKVYVAAIDGIAFGFGAFLAAACDLRLMADRDVAFGLPEPILGFVPAPGLTLLSRILDRTTLAEMVLEGRWLTAQESLERRVVHRLVAPERLPDEARAAALAAARRPERSIRELKRAVRDDAGGRVADGFAIDAGGWLATAASPAARRAFEAFVADLEGTTEPDELLAAWAQARGRDLNPPPRA